MQILSPWKSKSPATNDAEDTVTVEFTRRELSLLNQATTPERLAFMDRHFSLEKALLLKNRDRLCALIRGDNRY